jgi:hypothetical protein
MVRPILPAARRPGPLSGGLAPAARPQYEAPVSTQTSADAEEPSSRAPEPTVAPEPIVAPAPAGPSRLRAFASSFVDAVGSAPLWRELAPACLTVALWPWLSVCIRNYGHGTVWRDTPMYTYPAWCILHGGRLYDSIGVPDGPLAILIHLGMVVVGGLNEAAWRRYDLAFHVVFGLALGALVAGRAARHSLARRAAWAAVGLGMWLVQLMNFDFPASTQREAYYCGMGMVGVALVYASAERSKRAAGWMIGAGALLAGLTFWGKQTAGLYLVFVALTALVLPARAERPLLWRAKWVGIGTGVSVAIILLFLLVAGSVRGMWTYYFEYNLVYYRFHDASHVADILGFPWARDAYNIAGVALVVGVVALAARLVPLRAVAFMVAPAVEAASAVLQMRGWRYHYIPACYTAGVCFLVLLACAWRPDEVSAGAGAGRRPNTSMMAAAGAFLFVAWWNLGVVLNSPWMKESEAHAVDPAGLDPQAAGKMIAEHTHSDDRVYHFGDDPAVTLFAQRLPATPYEVAWMRDMMRKMPLAGDMRLTSEQEARVRALEKRFESDDCGRVMADPPAALVFHDGSVGYAGSIIDVVYGYCPQLRPVIEKRYHRIQSGPYQIYLRDDRP